MDMWSGFRMNREDVCASLRKGSNERVHGGDHQVHIERLVRAFAELFDHRRAKGQVWHEMPIHDVDMDHVCASMVYGGNLFTEAREICRENRGGNQHVAHAQSLSWNSRPHKVAGCPKV